MLDNEDKLTKPKLKEWLRREELRRKITEASEVGNKENFLEFFFSLLSGVFDIPIQELEELPWLEIAVAYIRINNLQVLSYDFPMLLAEKSKKEQTDWNYEGREWFIWLHLLAKNYGWSIEYIEELDVDNAVALLHEINSSKFEDREWEWGLSEFSYKYDSNTGVGKFIELPKPEWMQIDSKKKELPKTKIRKDFMPAGIVKSGKDNAEYPEST